MLSAIAERLEAPIAVDRSHDIPDDTRETPEDTAAASDAAGTVASEDVMPEGVMSEDTASETAADDPVDPQTEGRAG